MELEVESDNMQITINESLEALGNAISDGATLEDALMLDEDFLELYEEYQSIYEAVNLYYAYYLETGSITDA